LLHRRVQSALRQATDIVDADVLLRENAPDD